MDKSELCIDDQPAAEPSVSSSTSPVPYLDIMNPSPRVVGWGRTTGPPPLPPHRRSARVGQYAAGRARVRVGRTRAGPRRELGREHSARAARIGRSARARERGTPSWSGN